MRRRNDGAGSLDLREVDEADVYIDDNLAARLVRQRGDTVSFDYVDDDAFRDRAIRDDSVSGLGLVTSSTKTSADDHLTLLLAVGADTIGNIRVFPAVADPTFPRRF